MDLGLKGKVAVITGGSVGIGLAVAEGLAAEGAHLVLAARDERPARRRRRGDRRAARRARRCRSPATSRRPRAARRWSPPPQSEFGGADILINNAGTGSNETILEAPDEKWQYYWDLHVMAAVRLARGLVPPMKAARRRGDPAQRLDLRGAAALVRADLQRHQGGADDVLQDARRPR